ncbi:DNA primase [Mesobacterium pallidum]|uniref:DNA primase n=1 Tax=Mesobacterium pallidum TaxID=2872037 RepID=UPI001EE27EC4|nr:DNA primase [Mesobacterium pallidum]
MSLPPGFLDELRNRTSLTQVVGRKVMWDQRKSNQAKGDMWAPCPFHQEKSASFHVDDRKGFYYCFGCHAKGDAISFVRETENVEFMEAIRILAGEAGMPMPERDPQAAQKSDRLSELAEVMEAAVRFFRMQLNSGAAGAARDYLARRGLDAATLERFEIGFAPPGWEALREHLAAKGVKPDLMLAAGLVKASDRGRAPYDVFRDRIMFPIRDARGRAIAFGGRAMDPNDKAKYLNSPETELFDKGRNLYNHGPARAAAGKGQPLIVAEGYMDVIALASAGFEASVAPLGTAVTETQLQLLWRISDEPIIALDGDTAGLRAAYRVIDLALPLLEAGKSLRFALMPEGKDPDDLLRAEGPEAVERVLGAAMPMVRLLWQQETEGKVFDSPERKATLDKALRARITAIQDPSLRRHYGDEIKELRYQLFRPARPQWTGGRKGSRAWNAPQPASATAKSSLLAAAGDEVQVHLREQVVLAVLLRYPQFIDRFEPDLEKMTCTDPEHARLRGLLLGAAGEGPEALRARIEDALGCGPLEKLQQAAHVAITPCLRRQGEVELAEATVIEQFTWLEARRGLATEIEEAIDDLNDLPDEVVTRRLRQAAEAHQKALRNVQEDRTEYETGPNGAAINRAERDALDALLQQISGPRGDSGS